MLKFNNNIQFALILVNLIKKLFSNINNNYFIEKLFQTVNCKKKKLKLIIKKKQTN